MDALHRSGMKPKPKFEITGTFAEPKPGGTFHAMVDMVPVGNRSLFVGLWKREDMKFEQPFVGHFEKSGDNGMSMIGDPQLTHQGSHSWSHCAVERHGSVQSC
jgi:hypothetical protein